MAVGLTAYSLPPNAGILNLMPKDESDEKSEHESAPETKPSWYRWFEKSLWVFLVLVGITISAAISLAIFYYAPWQY